jgi:hypothetical protein
MGCRMGGQCLRLDGWCGRVDSLARAALALRRACPQPLEPTCADEVAWVRVGVQQASVQQLDQIG